MTSQGSAFWHGVDDQVHDMIIQEIPVPILEESISKIDPSAPSDQKYALLEILARAEVKQRQNANPGSAHAVRSILHTLGLLQSQQQDHVAGEATWRELLANNDIWRPNLAALYNLAHCLQLQKKYAEGETILRPLIECLKVNIGQGSQQAIGSVRTLGACVGGQGRVAEGKEILDVARTLAEALESKADAQAHLSDIQEVVEEMGLY